MTLKDKHSSEFKSFQISILVLPPTSYLPYASVFPPMNNLRYLTSFIPKLLVKHYCKDRAAVYLLAGILSLLLRLADSSRRIPSLARAGWEYP